VIINSVKMAQMIRTDKIYCMKEFFISKGSPSRQEHKSGVSVLTTIEQSLPVEFTKSGI
jgi:hypothetical protein